jgi:uncharacterized membrane protein
MNYLTLFLRLAHILSGIFWVGAALLMNFYVGPTIRATGDGGKQFAGYFMTKTKFTITMNVSVFVTLIAGFWLYGIDSQWFSSPWMRSGAGTGFGIGAFFALIGFVTGFMNGGNNRKLAALGSQIQGKPTPEQMEQLSAIQKQQGWVVPVNTWTLVLAVFFMAIARYLVF